MNQIKKRRCIICGNIFEYRTKARCRVNRVKSYRGKNMITCSTKCSKIYDRVSHFVRSKYKLKYPKNKEILTITQSP